MRGSRTEGMEKGEEGEARAPACPSTYPSSSLPARPPFPSAPHLRDPSGTVGVWLTSPPGGVMQFLKPAVGSLALAEWLIGPAREAVFARFPQGPLTLVMDLTSMTSRDPLVRPRMIEAGKTHRARIAQAIWIPPQNSTAVYRASLKVASSLMNVLGVRVEIHSSIAYTVRALRLTAAPEGA